LTELPIPPLEYRRLVGPTDSASFDNPTGQLIFSDVPDRLYDSVFDFGCGCGRLARQLIQQQQRPRTYIGVDPHGDMVDWCRSHLAPHAAGFRFLHHNVRHELLNAASPGYADLPVQTESVTLFIAWSVFTHLLEEAARFYLGELTRCLTSEGVAVTTWFTFDKRDFPMMQEFQNALFINPMYLTNAVIFDRAWLRTQAERVGLVMVRITPPDVRGFQWKVVFQKAAPGRRSVEFPEDRAPDGIVRPFGG
jgi:SAM-dependent methyltransferase